MKLLDHVIRFLNKNSIAYTVHQDKSSLIDVLGTNCKEKCLLYIAETEKIDPTIKSISLELPIIAIINDNFSENGEINLLSNGIQEVIRVSTLDQVVFNNHFKKATVRFRSYEDSSSRGKLINSLVETLPFQMAYRIEERPGQKARFVHVGEGVRTISGLSPDDVINNPRVLYEQIIPEDRLRFKNIEEHAVKTLAPFEIEVRKKDVAGNLKWVHICSFPKTRADGSLIWDGIENDITKYKEAEEEVKKLLERNEALLMSERHARAESDRHSKMKDQFLATLSHELRNPISSVLGWIRLLRAGKLTPEQARKAIDTVERNANIQAKLIEELLDMNRIISGKLLLENDTVNFYQLILATIENIRPTAEVKSIIITFSSYSKSDLYVFGDAAKLQQIVNNLLSNAVKFTHEGGIIETILHKEDSNVKLTIRDNGIGIEPQFLGHVFERFRQADASSTRKYGGLGLGLAIVKHLTGLHGGSIKVDSAGKGRGTTFTLYLPSSESRMELINDLDAHDNQSVNSQLTIPGINILLIDDDLDALELVGHLLTQSGALLKYAHSAEQALTQLAVNNCNFDVIISDIGMPEKDGIDLLKEMRIKFPETINIPVLALTAFARPEDHLRILEAGFLRHLTKPVDTIELLCVIKDTVAKNNENSIEL